MGRNEIRLRRNMMSSGRIAQHRNYTELMRQHSRENKLKMIFRVFLYFLIILFLLIILITVLRWERKQETRVLIQKNAYALTFTGYTKTSTGNDASYKITENYLRHSTSQSQG
jgi:uncharacterized protein YpmS